MVADGGDTRARATLREHLLQTINGKAKPPGSLGRLEELALQIGLITQSSCPDLGRARVLVFAGDHGITAEAVTAYPSAITREIAKLVLAGRAGINVCAEPNMIDVVLVDAGMLEPLRDDPLLIDRRIAAGTRNFRDQPAMSEMECHAALQAGREIALDLERQQIGVVGIGEIGIGNTSSAALLGHVMTGMSLDVLVGPGAGMPPGGLDHKRRVLEAALARGQIDVTEQSARAMEALRQFGGYEIAMMAGAIIAAAETQRVVVIDGFISTAASIIAFALEPRAREACIFSHCSAEPGHTALLASIDARPLLNLGLRLGEGTGAALAIPLIRAAAAMLREMADLPAADTGSGVRDETS